MLRFQEKSQAHRRSRVMWSEVGDLPGDTQTNKCVVIDYCIFMLQSKKVPMIQKHVLMPFYPILLIILSCITEVQSCTIPNCYHCPSDPAYCSACNNQHGQYGGNCIPCQNSNCKFCQYNFDQCRDCATDGYGLSGTNCVQCARTGCKYCSADPYSTCTGCFDGYYFSSGYCTACSTNNLYCQTCTGSTACTSCDDGFGVSSGTCASCISPCIKCSTNVNSCTACGTGYGVSSGSCVACTSPCIQCSTNVNVCTACNSGFGVTAGGSCAACTSPCLLCSVNINACTACDDGFGVSSGTCAACTSPCLLCSANVNICTACDDGFGVSGGNCVSCSDSQCLECSLSSTTCTFCGPLYGVSSGSCSSCQVQNCSQCGADDTVCTKCLPYVGLSGNTCVQCQDTNCLDCSTDYTVCTACAAGYGLYLGNCVTCLDTQCTDCRYQADVCLACSDGYGVFNNSCAPCDDNQCQLCPEDYANCTFCEPRFGVSSAACSPCSDSFCQICGLDSTICNECQAGYGLDGSGVCQVCDPSCLTCSPFDYQQCTSCVQRFYLSALNTCLPCISNCSECSNGVNCDICDDGFYVEPVGQTCSPCSTYCSLCFYSSTISLPQCTACVPGLLQLDPYSPPDCRQLCGDSYTTNYSCDNNLNTAYDGCNNDCQVQPDFVCEITVSFGTVCTYVGVIQVKFISFERSPTSNQLTIIFQIHPLLDILLTQNLLSLLKFSNPQMTIQQISIDPTNGQIQIKASFSSTLSNPTLILQLHQSQGYNISLVSSFPFFLSDYLTDSIIYFYDDLVFTINEVGENVMWVVVGLALLALILGMPLRKLGGLEALFVVQLCFFMVLFLNSPLHPPFESVSPLKYSTGYNPPIFSATIHQTSTKAPYYQQFKMDHSLLSNNINIGIFVEFLAFVVSLIMMVRLKKSERKVSIGKRDSIQESDRKVMRQVTDESSRLPHLDELQDRKKQDQEYERVNNQYQISLQIFLYISMINLTLLTTTAVLHVQKGTLIDISSLTMFGFGLILYMIAIIWYLRDPYSYGYFKNSFRSTRIGQKFYIIQSSYLVVAVCCISVMPLFNYIVLVPTTIFLVFIFVYKPYGYSKQNYRQCFNLFTIAAFASVCLYSHLHNNTLISYIIFIICLGFLLPVVLIWALISIIYYYYYENYVLKEDQAAEDKAEQDIIKRRVLNQIEMIDVRRPLAAIKQDTVFKKLASPKNSLLTISNNIKQEEQLKSHRKKLLAEGMLEQTNLQQELTNRKIRPQASKPKQIPSYSNKKLNSGMNEYDLKTQRRRKRKKEQNVIINNYNSITINNIVGNDSANSHHGQHGQHQFNTGTGNVNLNLIGYQSVKKNDSNGKGRQEKDRMQQYRKNDRNDDKKSKKNDGIIYGFDGVKNKNGNNVEPKNVILEDSGQSGSEDGNNNNTKTNGLNNKSKSTNIMDAEKRLQKGTNISQNTNMMKQQETSKQQLQKPQQSEQYQYSSNQSNYYSGNSNKFMQKTEQKYETNKKTDSYQQYGNKNTLNGSKVGQKSAKDGKQKNKMINETNLQERSPKKQEVASEDEVSTPDSTDLCLKPQLNAVVDPTKDIKFIARRIALQQQNKLIKYRAAEAEVKEEMQLEADPKAGLYLQTYDEIKTNLFS